MKQFGFMTVVAMFLVGLVVTVAVADDIVLTNGNRLTGTIVSLDAGHIKINTAYGTLDVPRGDIRTAVIGQPPAPATTGAPTAAPGAEAADNGLVAAWNLDGDASDSSGHGLDGAIKGRPKWTADRFGQQKGALAFDGNAANRFEIADRPELKVNQLTLAAWVTGNSPRLWARIVQKYNYPQKKGYALLFNHKEGTLAFDGWGTDDKSVWIHTKSKLSGDWQHVCVTYDGKLLRMYYNGKMEAERNITRTFRHTDGPLTIGGGNDGNMDFPWSGRIDAVRLYNRALSPEQVAALYQEKADGRVAADLTQKSTF